MRDINDDMDDLFRRAADNYPLNTNSSDWNKVKSALESPAVEDVREKKRRLGFLWLLLLLPAAFCLYKYGFQNLCRISPAALAARGFAEEVWN